MIHLECNQKLIVVINLYRIPDSTAAGVKTLLTQYNRNTGEERTARIY